MRRAAGCPERRGRKPQANTRAAERSAGRIVWKQPLAECSRRGEGVIKIVGGRWFQKEAGPVFEIGLLSECVPVCAIASWSAVSQTAFHPERGVTQASRGRGAERYGRVGSLVRRVGRCAQQSGVRGGAPGRCREFLGESGFGGNWRVIDGALARPSMFPFGFVRFDWPSVRRRVFSAAMKEPGPAWPHAPTHQLSTRGTYFVTAATYLKAHHFRGRKRLSVLHRGLLKVTEEFGWRLEAWAVFSNHYHFVAHSPDDQETAESLSQMLGKLHSKTGSWIKKLEAKDSLQVWHNFRETRLTRQRSYLARLNYVHQNAVRHGLVMVASQYPWCSAGWFERTASGAMVKSIYRFKTDRLGVDDDFDVAEDW